MKNKLDMAKIAKALRADRRGKVRAKGGHFGAVALLADVQGAVLSAGTWSSHRSGLDWTERRLVALAPATLRRLGYLAAR